MNGFSHGIRQMSQEISFTLPCQKITPTQNIDHWLEKAFQVKVDERRFFLHEPKNVSEAELLEFTLRIMYLANTLLQSIRIPSFAIGKVLSLSVTSKPNQVWTVVLMAPYVNHIDPITYKLAYRTAIAVVLALSNIEYSKKNSDEIFKIIEEKFSKNIQKNNFGGESTIPVLKSAWLKNIDFRHLGNGSYILGLGANSILINRGAIQSDSAIGASISSDKWCTARYLEDAGLPGPTHYRVDSANSSEQIVSHLGWPLVVKPIDRERGEGVSVNINNINQLNDSIQKALKLSKIVLIEKQVPGVCHRILVANRKVRLVAKRLPKSVKGDGQSTIRQLVELANMTENEKPPWSRLKPFPLDDMALQNLASNNLHPESIPIKDEFVPLRPIQTSEWGGVVEHHTDTIHPENSVIAIKAAALLGLSIAGIDIISSDITKPWFENGAIINEVNFSSLLSGTGTDGVINSILEEIVPNNGKILIEVFIGEEMALQRAKEIQLDFLKNGKKYWLTTDKLTISYEGSEVKFLFDNLFKRCQALLLDRQVEGLLVVIQNDELLTSGLPFQHIDRVHDVIESDVHLTSSINQNQNKEWKQRVKSLLNEYDVKK